VEALALPFIEKVKLVIVRSIFGLEDEGAQLRSEVRIFGFQLQDRLLFAARMHLAANYVIDAANVAIQLSSNALDKVFFDVTLPNANGVLEGEAMARLTVV
jgi:hypothetical protein